jgi:glycosyltransferase involved in cell wall biosynthesis
LLHGHYADGWETVTSLKSRLSHHPPIFLTTHSLGQRKRQDALERGEDSPEKLDKRYNFPIRIDSEENSLIAADKIMPLSTPEAEFLTAHYKSILPDDPRLNVIPNGIGSTDFPPPTPGARARVRDSLGITDSEFLLMVPSRVDPRKG